MAAKWRAFWWAVSTISISLWRRIMWRPCRQCLMAAAHQTRWNSWRVVIIRRIDHRSGVNGVLMTSGVSDVDTMAWLGVSVFCVSDNHKWLTSQCSMCSWRGNRGVLNLTFNCAIVLPRDAGLMMEVTYGRKIPLSLWKK